MRLLIDALGAPAASGGMRLHATEVLSAWATRYPDDDLIVVGGPWIADLGLSPRTRRFRWPNDNPVLRSVGQQLVVPLLYRLTRRTRVLATNCVTSPLLPAPRTTVTAHDWRHLRRPGEFSRFQRAYRRNWLRSARRAAHVVCVSEKTARETRRLVDPHKVTVVENGRDHAGAWPADSLVRPADAPEGPFVLTYGQHTNKRPELVVRALAADAVDPDLGAVVLGLQDDAARALGSEATRLGVRHRVDLRGYVAEGEYRWLVSHAAVVAVVSSDEGFGLPLAEAAAVGVPAVVTADSGVADLFEMTAVVADPTAESVAGAIHRARGARPPTGPTAGSTWAMAVDALRELVSRSG